MLAPSVEVQNLQTARNLIADEAKWFQGNLFRRMDGSDSDCQLNVDEGVAFCAIGALYKSGFDSTALALLNDAAIELFALDPDTLGLYPAAHVNDFLGHAAVMRMYDRAIELAMRPAPPAKGDERK